MISFHILPCDHEQINNLLPLAKLLPDKRRDELLSLVDEMPLGLTITVEKIKKERSRQQEKYYRKWLKS